METYPPILLKSEKQRQHLLEVVKSLPLDEDKPLAVSVETYAKVRSRRANALYWVRLAHISKHIIFENGDNVKHMDRNWWHSWLALKFLEPVWIHSPIDGQELPVPRSTKQLKAKEFTEYMEKIAEWARDLNLILPNPEDQDAGIS